MTARRPSRVRGGLVLLGPDGVAAIERTRGGRVYHVLPGGGCEPGETPADAATREAYEELGLRIRLRGLLAVVRFGAEEQHYFAGDLVGGTFGTGEGAELTSDPQSERGAYRPVWLASRQLPAADLRPRPLADLLIAAGTNVRDAVQALLARPAFLDDAQPRT